MAKEYKGTLIKDKVDGEMLKDILPEGDMIVSEGPKGEPLWKKKKKLNEEEENQQRLNE
jgi:hypothetical protein